MLDVSSHKEIEEGRLYSVKPSWIFSIGFAKTPFGMEVMGVGQTLVRENKTHCFQVCSICISSAGQMTTTR